MTVKQTIEIGVFIIAALYLTYRDQAKLLRAPGSGRDRTSTGNADLHHSAQRGGAKAVNAHLSPFQIARGGADKNATDVRNLCDLLVGSTHERDEHR